MGSNRDLTRARWRKSSYSGSSGGDCLEFADLTPHTAIRDSKNPTHGTLTVTPKTFATFVTATADGAFG